MNSYPIKYLRISFMKVLYDKTCFCLIKKNIYCLKVKNITIAACVSMNISMCLINLLCYIIHRISCRAILALNTLILNYSENACDYLLINYSCLYSVNKNSEFHLASML